MRVHIVDPSAFTPAYDHALCRALAAQEAKVTLVTSRFPYGAVPTADGYTVAELFYRAARGAPGTPVRTAWKLAEHVPDMLRYRRMAAEADVVHFQWLDLALVDGRLLPARPLVFTAHDLLPREPRPGQVLGQRRLYRRVDAVVVHSAYGRAQLIDRVGVPADKVHVIPHGAFTHLCAAAVDAPLPHELLSPGPDPVVLFFGLLRPYKGIEALLRAFAGIDGARLWIVGRPRLPLAPLLALAPKSVTFVPRFVTDDELAACFRRADVVVLPYSHTERFDQSGVLAAALAFGKPIVLTRVGGFPEVAATGAAVLVDPGDEHALQAALATLVGDPAARERLSSAARRAAAGPYSWVQAARRTLALYEQLAR